MQYLQLAIALFGEQKASQLNQQQLDLLAQQYSDMKGIPLPELEKMTADQLGPSAVGSMQSDQGMRSKQLQAIAELQNVVDKGGLDLNDHAALEESLDTARKQESRARAGVASDAAQRGQLNSGSRLLMDMNAAQSGANTARQTGLQTAGMAQQRRLAAIHDVSADSGALREQDWREAETANRAKDLRDERNAAAREKAQYYNAGLPQQNFSNAMSKATGTQPAANAYSGGLGAAATDARGSAAGIAGVVGAASSGSAYGGVTSNGGADPGGTTYEYDDLTGNRDGHTDLGKNPDDK